MRATIAWAMFCVALLAGLATADNVDVPQRRYLTARLDAAAPRIDGRHDDPAWDAVPWSGEFIQRQPDDGAPPSQQRSRKLVFSPSGPVFTS